MHFSQQSLFWCGNSLEAIILLRLLYLRSFRKYLLFSSYLFLILVRSLVDLYVLQFHSELYSRVYWYFTEPLSSVLGSLVIFELYRNLLEQYPGAARIARRIIAIVFALLVSRFIVQVSSGQGWELAAKVMVLERDLRIVQSVFLVGILALIHHYALSVGRNLKGMIGGYGIYIGLQIMSITLRSQLGDSAQAWWIYVHPLCYLLVLGIWVVALWRYDPMPSAHREAGPELDYRTILGRTLAQLDEARSSLSKSVWP